MATCKLVALLATLAMPALAWADEEVVPMSFEDPQRGRPSDCSDESAWECISAGSMSATEEYHEDACAGVMRCYWGERVLCDRLGLVCDGDEHVHTPTLDVTQ